MADAGLDDFYRGELAHTIAADLEAAGRPLRAPDLAAQRALRQKPLPLRAFGATVDNLPQPPQGLASLLILVILEQVGCLLAEGPVFVQRLVSSEEECVGTV